VSRDLNLCCVWFFHSCVLSKWCETTVHLGFTVPQI
jgi:hypothetical protein